MRAGGGAFKGVTTLATDDVKLTCGKYGTSLPTTGSALACGPEWMKCDNYADDNLHFTPAGYELLTAWIAPVFASGN